MLLSDRAVRSAKAGPKPSLGKRCATSVVCLLLATYAFEVSAADPASKRTSVEVGVYVIDISEVQEREQSVVADFAVIATWHQDELADPDAPELRRVPLSEVDSPRLFILNGRKLGEKFERFAEIDRSGRVLHRQRYQGTLSTPMHLEDFPLDVQTFDIVIGTLDHRNRTLVADASRSGSMKSFTVAGWMIRPEKLQAGKQLAPDGRHHYSTLTAVYTGKRNGLFFAWKLFIPLGLIVCMAYAVFWLDPTVLGPQIGIATSTVFTLIAYNFALSTILPPISYLTRADLYLMGCMLLVFGALGEAVVTGVLATNESQLARARRIDVIARFVYPVLFVVIIAIAFS